MSRPHLKLWIGGAILAVAVGYLAFAGVRQGCSYFLEVDDFLADSSYHTGRVRLLGTVGDVLTDESAEGPLRFQLCGKTGKLAVVYEGVVPDRFKVGGEVVVGGALAGEGLFKADQLLTKCASKYERLRAESERQR